MMMIMMMRMMMMIQVSDEDMSGDRMALDVVEVLLSLYPSTTDQVRISDQEHKALEQKSGTIIIRQISGK